MTKPAPSAKGGGPATTGPVTTTGRTYTWPDADCHDDPTLVFSVGHCRVFAGAARRSRADDGGRWSMVIACNGDAPPAQSSRIRFRPNERLLAGLDGPTAGMLRSRATEPLPPPPAWLGVSWPDFGTPALANTDWHLLAEILAQHGANTEAGDVLICCDGGHGRTGTALAILGVLLEVCKEGDPVAWVRAIYCDNAVESDGQIRLIESLTGRKVECRGAGFGATRGNSSGGKPAGATLPGFQVRPPGGSASLASKYDWRSDFDDEEDIAKLYGL